MYALRKGKMKNKSLYGIHYNWYQHPQAGELYHHFYVGAQYDSTDKGHVAIVTFIEDLGKGQYKVSFDNGVDRIVSNVNQIIVKPDELSESETDS